MFMLCRYAKFATSQFVACFRLILLTSTCDSVGRYKVCWTPETSDLVHGRVAKRLVDCLRRNEGLYVKFGQAMSTMDTLLHLCYVVLLT